MKLKCNPHNYNRSLKPQQASVKNYLNIVKSWGKKKDLKDLWKNKSFDENNLPIG